jgi:NodT family efflux transporter outer membrane factor (OMF) lipoprotein
MRGHKPAALLAAVSLSACSLAPAYTPPAATSATPVAFRETGPWTPAAPADAVPRGPWWQVFGDPQLDSLEARIEGANPQLAAALARYDQAKGYSRQARAARFPTLDANASAERSRDSTNGQQHEFIVGGSLSYELDLWGRVRNLVAAGKADVQASEADLASVRLSLQAELADDYMQLRGLDAQIAVLEATVDAFGKALKLNVARHDGGASSGVDVGRAQTQLSAARAQLDQSRADRALMEHAIAALVGEPASTFTIAPVQMAGDPPAIPVSAPSLLLQRRPDIAAAERRMAAANARVGVARAAMFPNITLGGSGGFDTTGGALFSAATGFWALGPALALLSVFDGGRRKGQVEVARGEFDEAAANYRQTVLTAFREVEDQMTLANRLADAETNQLAAVTAAVRTNKLATIRYREGAADYLEVVTAQTAELDARRLAVDIRARRMAASVNLIRALGGGWQGPGSGVSAAALN